MKRVLPIVILVTIIEIIGVIWLGIWLFNYEKLHISVVLLYVVFTTFFALSIPLRFIALDDMYHSYKDVGKRFEELEIADFWPLTFIWTMGSIFNKIDSFDFIPIINQWKQFWGYETSSSNINFSNNC